MQGDQQDPNGDDSFNQMLFADESEDEWGDDIDMLPPTDSFAQYNVKHRAFCIRMKQYMRQDAFKIDEASNEQSIQSSLKDLRIINNLSHSVNSNLNSMSESVKISSNPNSSNPEERLQRVFHSNGSKHMHSLSLKEANAENHNMQIQEQQQRQDEAPQNIEEEVKFVREEEQEIQVRPRHRLLHRHQHRHQSDVKSTKQSSSDGTPVSAASMQNFQEIVVPRAVAQSAAMKDMKIEQKEIDPVDAKPRTGNTLGLPPAPVPAPVPGLEPEVIDTSEILATQTLEEDLDDDVSIDWCMQRRRLQSRLKQIENMPFNCKEFERTKKNLLIEIWVQTGMIDHGLNEEPLRDLAIKFAKF